MDADDNIIETYKKFIGEYTNNFAEYTALVESAKLLKNLNYNFDIINFYSDSELIVKQIKGNYKIKNKDLIRLSLEFWNEIKTLNKKFTITQIPRDKNKLADKLANEASDEKTIDRIDRNLLIKE